MSGSPASVDRRRLWVEGGRLIVEFDDGRATLVPTVAVVVVAGHFPRGA